MADFLSPFAEEPSESVSSSVEPVQHMPVAVESRAEEEYTSKTKIEDQVEDDDIFPDMPERGSCGFWIGFFLILLAVLLGVWFFFFRAAPDFRETVNEKTVNGKNEKMYENSQISEVSYSKIIGEDGDKVQYFDGAFIDIPAGALKNPVRISIEKIRNGRVTDVYHLKPDGFRFQKPVTVALPYNPKELAENETPNGIILYTGDTEHIFPVQNITVANTRINLVSTKISSF